MGVMVGQPTGTHVLVLYYLLITVFVLFKCNHLLEVLSDLNSFQ
jgi:hypothetical protein